MSGQPLDGGARATGAATGLLATNRAGVCLGVDTEGREHVWFPRAAGKKPVLRVQRLGYPATVVKEFDTTDRFGECFEAYQDHVAEEVDGLDWEDRYDV